MAFPTPNYSNLPPITADLNHLYNKHQVTVYPILGVAQGSMGGQRTEFGTPYQLVCNVQLRRLDEHDNPVRFTNSSGILYTATFGRLQKFDEFIFEGVRYKIDGVENFRDNIQFQPHHTEAIFTQTQSTTRRM